VSAATAARLTATAGLTPQILKSNEQVLLDLKRAIQDDEVVPFVGAGMSKPIFPLWTESLLTLIEGRRLWDEAQKADVRRLVETAKFEEAASQLADDNPRFTSGIYTEFGNARIDPAKLARMAVRLLPEIFPGPVVTTNFDRVLERVYHGRLEPVIPPFGELRPAQARAVTRRGSEHLVKIHGCVSRECNLVFTKENYDEAYGEKFDGAGAKYLRRLLEGRRMVFLGCGLRQDRTLSLVESIALGFDGDHFAVVEAPKDLAADDFNARWKRLEDAGIDCYWYPHGAHSEVEAVLNYLLGSSSPGGDGSASTGGGGPARTAATPLVGGSPGPGSPAPASGTVAPGVTAAFEAVTPAVEAPPSVILPPAATTLIRLDQPLADLEQALAGSLGAVLVGPGGSGKTTLAQEYVRAKAGDYAWVWWLDASSQETLSNSLAGEGRKALTASGAAGVDLMTDADAADHARRLLHGGAGWLIVLDGATEMAEIQGAMTATPSGKFLVTTREERDWQSIGLTPVAVEPLSLEDAVRLLVARARPASPDGWETTGPAGELVRKLGCLPLAVAQVGALLHLDGARDPSAMLAQWRWNPAARLGEAVPGTPQERTMAHVWDLSITRLEERDTSAVRLLAILGWLGPPERIPRSLLDALPADTFPADPGRPLREAAAAGLLSLNGDVIAIHPVLHLVLRTPDETVPQRVTARVGRARATAVTLLRATLGDDDPNDPAVWPVIRSVAGSAEVLASQPAWGRDGDATDVVRKVAWFLSGHGSHQQAVTLSRWDRERAEQALTPDHPDLLDARGRLASALRLRGGPGDLEEAIALHKRVAADRERVLGPDHPDTLTSRNNLALTLWDRGGPGDLKEAIALHKRVAADSERVLGPDHPNTLTYRNNLAITLARLGDRHNLSRAVEIFEGVVDGRTRVLGPDHPDTEASKSGLAWTRRQLAELDQ
jgi:hypothetical protein